MLTKPDKGSIAVQVSAAALLDVKALISKVFVHVPNLPKRTRNVFSTIIFPQGRIDGYLRQGDSQNYNSGAALGGTRLKNDPGVLRSVMCKTESDLVLHVPFALQETHRVSLVGSEMRLLDLGVELQSQRSSVFLSRAPWN
jgi:hypothetical protein